MSIPYGLLVDLVRTYERYLNPNSLSGLPLEKGRADDVLEKWFAFKETFEHKRLYLEVELCERLEILTMKIMKSAAELATVTKMAKEDTTGHPPIDPFKTWIQSVSFMEEDVPEAMSALETEFRKLLGINRID